MKGYSPKDMPIAEILIEYFIDRRNAEKLKEEIRITKNTIKRIKKLYGTS